MFDDVKKIVSDYNEAQAEFSKKMKATFGDMFTRFFAAYPEITGIGWTQYAPSFNDGEPCEFGVHGFNFTNQKFDAKETSATELEEMEFNYTRPAEYIYRYAAGNGTDAQYYKDLIEEYNKTVAEKGDRFDEVATACEEFEKLLESIPDDIFESVFGSGASIVATAAGFEVDDCYDCGY